jgi:regulator of sirC expression with transglutaminase-like and TPR domain
MYPQRDAILKLLADDDERTRALVRTQLASGGLAALSQLQDLLTMEESRARIQLTEVIGAIEREHADAIFEQVCTHFGDHGDIEEAAWRLAASFEPGLDFRASRRQLDIWGEEASRRLRKAGNDQEEIETLIEFLGHDLGFRGNDEDYYNINNSLLPEVVATRRGLPITLSLVYMLVGRRAGLLVEGVGLPGHFIVRCGDAFFDPFHGGKRLGYSACRELLEAQNQTLSPEHLQPVSSRQILARMLANLHNVAVESDPPLARKIADWLSLLSTTARGERPD